MPGLGIGMQQAGLPHIKVHVEIQLKRKTQLPQVNAHQLGPLQQAGIGLKWIYPKRLHDPLIGNPQANSQTKKFVDAGSGAALDLCPGGGRDVVVRVSLLFSNRTAYPFDLREIGDAIRLQPSAQDL